MSLRSLTRREVIDLADSSQLFFRGEEYCDSGQVYKFSFSGNRINSKVHGHYGDYTVKVSEDARDPDELEWSCDCPYDGEICKHVIAVLLYHLKQRSKNSESMGAKIPP